MTQKMFKLLASISLFLTLIWMHPVQVCSDSLWESAKGSVYGSQKRDIQVGDIVTILISESTTAAQEATTKTTKESEMGTNLLSNWDLISNVLNESAHRTYDLSLKGDDKYSGAGTTTRKSRVTAVVTAVVTEVLENGNVYVVGEHKVKVNNEVETIRISGIIRPGDIGPNNSVNSFQIAKAEVSVNGSGVVGAKQSPGVMTKMFNWLF